MKLISGKLYILRKSPKRFWEINDNNFIVCLTVPGFETPIPKGPIMFLGTQKIGMSTAYFYLTKKLVKTFHTTFMNDLKELK